MQVAPPERALHDITSVEALAALSIAFFAAIAIALLVGSLTRRLFVSVDRGHTQPYAKAALRAVRRVTFVISFMLLSFPALDLAGVELGVGLHPEDVTRWLFNSGARVLLLIVLAYAANHFVASVIRNAEAEMATGNDLATQERRKRLHTLGATSRRFISILIWTAAGLMVLRELDVDITPVLTGAGIIGLAVGFGAQTLVKDIISGLFLIAEDQVRLDDSAQINGVSGTVEEINLRTIVLRDVHGVAHHIANGEIRTLANRSKDYSYFVFDLVTGYELDTDRVVQLVRDTARELMLDPEYAATILAPLEVFGVDAFRGSDATLRFRIKTLPLKQDEVGRELRRRLKKVFMENGIQSPQPQMNVTLKQISL